MAIGNEKNYHTMKFIWALMSFNFNFWKIYQKSNKYLLVRYEDLIRDTKKEFIKILNFINSLGSTQFPIFEEKLDMTIDTTNFYKMKKLEEIQGFEEAKNQ